jgi:CTP synthase
MAKGKRSTSATVIDTKSTPDLIERIEAEGLVFVGKDETGQRCEIFELTGHPYYVGVQYHPEFKSRPGRPSPPFLGLLKASTGQM